MACLNCFRTPTAGALVSAPPSPPRLRPNPTWLWRRWSFSKKRGDGRLSDGAQLSPRAFSTAVGERQASKDLSGVLGLGNIRQTLIRLEDTIIFGLIERAQFARNQAVYDVPGVEMPNTARPGICLLEYILRETEQIHGRIRRYTSPDEHAYFPEDLPRIVLPPISYDEVRGARKGVKTGAPTRLPHGLRPTTPAMPNACSTPQRPLPIPGAGPGAVCRLNQCEQIHPEALLGPLAAGNHNPRRRRQLRLRRHVRRHDPPGPFCAGVW